MELTASLPGDYSLFTLDKEMPNRQEAMTTFTVPRSPQDQIKKPGPALFEETVELPAKDGRV